MLLVSRDDREFKRNSYKRKVPCFEDRNVAYNMYFAEKYKRRLKHRLTNNKLLCYSRDAGLYIRVNLSDT